MFVVFSDEPTPEEPEEVDSRRFRIRGTTPAMWARWVRYKLRNWWLRRRDY